MLKDLKELAKLKMSIDVLKEMYEQRVTQLKEEMIKAGVKEVDDPNGLLKIKLVSNNRREFSVEGVRETFGDKASICISESVDARKFDLLCKDGDGKYTINESQQTKCFTTKTNQPSLTWDGLKAYQSHLEPGEGIKINLDKVSLT